MAASATRFVFPPYGDAGAIAGKLFGYSVVRLFGSVTGTVAMKTDEPYNGERGAAAHGQLHKTRCDADTEEQDRDPSSPLRTHLDLKLCWQPADIDWYTSGIHSKTVTQYRAEWPEKLRYLRPITAHT